MNRIRPENQESESRPIRQNLLKGNSYDLNLTLWVEGGSPSTTLSSVDHGRHIRKGIADDYIDRITFFRNVSPEFNAWWKEQRLSNDDIRNMIESADFGQLDFPPSWEDDTINKAYELYTQIRDEKDYRKKYFEKDVKLLLNSIK